MDFIFPYIWDNHPNGHSYFSEGWLNHQPDGDLAIRKVLNILLTWIFSINLGIERARIFNCGPRQMMICHQQMPIYLTGLQLRSNYGMIPTWYTCVFNQGAFHCFFRSPEGRNIVSCCRSTNESLNDFTYLLR